MAGGWRWAIAAGSSAAGAAAAAKLGTETIRLEFKLLCYAAVVGFNVVMWSCYVRSLITLSSLYATVVNFAANFLITGLAGLFLFREELHPQWFAGACCIVLGIWILSRAEVCHGPNKRD